MKEFSIYKTNGEITSLKVLTKHLNELPDGKYNVRIDKKGRRSLPLNKYYWGCVIEFEQEGFKKMGEYVSKEQIHDFNKTEFAYKEIVNHETGEIKRMPGSTKDMTNVQMLEFIERIKQFCAEWLNTYIPDPNEAIEINYDQ